MPANAPSSPERLRVMFVVGVMADLEASLRATASASEKRAFGVAAAQKVYEDIVDVFGFLRGVVVKREGLHWSPFLEVSL